jgi:integrase
MTRPARFHAPGRPWPRRAVPAATSSALALLLRPTPELPAGTAVNAALAEADADAAAKAAAEVVEAELVDDDAAQDPFDELSVDRVLDAFIDQKTKRLVPARLAEVTDLGDGSAEVRAYRLERARLLDELRANAWADGTLRNYGMHVRAWRAWCRTEGVPALPFRPDQVANFLLDYTFIYDEEAGEFARDADDGLLPAVAAGTVDNRLAALNLAAQFIGIARPGDNPGIVELIRGIRRRLGVAPRHRRAAMDLARLDACLAAATGARFTATRTRAAVLIRARTGASAGQLAELGWADIVLEEHQVTLELAPASRWGEPVTVVVPAHPNAELCLVRTLRQLRTMATGRLDRVFGRPAVTAPRRPRKGEPPRTPAYAAGDPMTRPALYKAVNAAAAPAGGWDALPGLSDRELARLLTAECPVTPLATARDRALLLTGFWTAGRRSNLSALNWRDVTDHGEDGLAVEFRRSKTDQLGFGKTKWLPQAPPGSDKACPATALREWRAQLTAALGRPPHPDEPVFTRLTGVGTLKRGKDGRLPARLTGEGVNDVVQRLAVAAGLMGKPKPGEKAPYGAHSLRAGFTTQAFRDNKLSLLEVQEVTDHKSLEMLSVYRREVQAPKSNAARKMMM